MPTGVVTVTSTVPPRASAGETAAVIEVAEVTVYEVAARAPKATAVASVKPEPVTVTGVAPPVGPATGLTALTVGTPS